MTREQMESRLSLLGYYPMAYGGKNFVVYGAEETCFIITNDGRIDTACRISDDKPSNWSAMSEGYLRIFVRHLL